jgi:hypothetical protein
VGLTALGLLVTAASAPIGGTGVVASPVPAAKAAATTTIATTQVQGEADLALRPNGTPVIVFPDATQKLKVASCSDAACTGKITVVDLGVTGIQPKIIVGSNNRPIILHTGIDGLWAIACTTATCKGPRIPTRLDNGGKGTPGFVSVTMAVTGLPVISYLQGPSRLRTVTCGNNTCSGFFTYTTFPIDGNGGPTAIGIQSNSFPIVAHTTEKGLRTVACKDLTCSAKPVISIVDTRYAMDVDIAVGPSGHPVIAYPTPDKGLRVAACTTVDCSGKATITTVQSMKAFNTTFTASIAILSNGKPIISYSNGAKHDLKVAACSTATCSGTATISTLDSNGNTGNYPAMAIRTNGRPIIVYTRESPNKVKVAACAKATCAP